MVYENSCKGCIAMSEVDEAEVGDLIKVNDPVWDWIKKDDMGIIIKKTTWDDSRCNYKVRFARSNQIRIINRREFEIVCRAQVPSGRSC